MVVVDVVEMISCMGFFAVRVTVVGNETVLCLNDSIVGVVVGYGFDIVRLGCSRMSRNHFLSLKRMYLNY